MAREYPEWPIIGVGGVVVHEHKVLLVRRAHPPMQGDWSIPGGALEVGETLVEALRRELLEETGLTVTPVGVLEVLDRIVRDEQGRTRFHYVLIDYLCHTEEAVACAASDATDCCWVSPEELAAYGLRPDTLRVLDKALNAVTL